MRVIHANRFGKGEDMIIIHGFLGMGDNWKSLGKKWADNGYCVHLLDMRNHGRSFHDDDFNYQVMTDDVINYLTEQKIENCQVIGHSMGGKVAMLLATQEPHLIEKLVVVDIAPRYYPNHHDDILDGLAILEENQFQSRKEADKLLSEKIDEAGIRLFLMKNLYRDNNGQLQLRLNLKAIRENLDEIGKGLPDNALFTGPTLFIKGGRSSYIGDTDKKIIQHHFPNAELKTIENAGHWVHAEQPTSFFNEVNNHQE